MKLGKTSFNKEVCSKMTLAEFEMIYKGRLVGYDIKKAAKELGVKPNPKPKKKKDEDKED